MSVRKSVSHYGPISLELNKLKSSRLLNMGGSKQRKKICAFIIFL